MLFDCGHRTDTGRFTTNGLLCQGCAQAVQYASPPWNLASLPREVPAEQDPEKMALARLIKKRLPPGWPDDEIQRTVRLWVRLNGALPTHGQSIYRLCRRCDLY